MRKQGRFWVSVALSAALLAALPACTGAKKGDPKSVLGEYVSRSLVIKDTGDKSKLMELTTGDAKQTLERLSDGDFKSNFIDSHREFISLKIRDERPLTETRFSITYELTYKSRTPNSDDLVTLKKHAVLVKEGQPPRWLISEVQNLKTNVEHQNAVTF